jgi:hypothetical protein
MISAYCYRYWNGEQNFNPNREPQMSNLNNELDALRAAIASLVGCKACEVEGEVRLVVNQINAVKATQAGRIANERTATMIGRAMDVIAQRRAAALERLAA